MKVVAQDNVKRKLWQVGIEPIDSYGKIDKGIGMMKGDLIAFAGEGDPRRLPSGAVAGKVLLTDPTAETGWVLGSAGGNPTITIKNGESGQVLAGRVVALNYGTTVPTFVLATTNVNRPLYITSDDSGAGESVECYGIPGTIVPVLCEGTVAVGNKIAITSTGYCGKATNSSKNVIGVALTAKTVSAGYDIVKVLLLGTGGIYTGDIPESEDPFETFTGTTLTLKDKYEHRNNSTVSSLTITLPSAPSDMFHATVSFSADANFTGVVFKQNNATYAIKNVGHALTKKSVRYNLGVWWDGVYFWCSTKTA